MTCTFSVVIPTLQRSVRLHPLVDAYVAHPLVGEVLVINNAPEHLDWDSPKVRVLQMPENIYVNPAWNLGAREAVHDALIFSNDDIGVEPRMITAAARRLREGTGIIFACPHSARRRRRVPLWFSPATRRLDGMGVWFAMPRSSYVPIPEDMKIWCGDDWLFSRQGRRQNYVMHGARVPTEMSTSSSDPTFSATLIADLVAFETTHHRPDLEPARPTGPAGRVWRVVEKVHHDPRSVVREVLRRMSPGRVLTRR